MYWLGLDIGTGGSRALLIDERGVVQGLGLEANGVLNGTLDER